MFTGLASLILLAVYFIPTIIAICRKHDNTVAIILVNILLGWTFIGWVVALIWSVTSQKKQTIVINNNNTSGGTRNDQTN